MTRQGKASALNSQSSHAITRSDVDQWPANRFRLLRECLFRVEQSIAPLKPSVVGL